MEHMAWKPRRRKPHLIMIPAKLNFGKSAALLCGVITGVASPTTQHAKSTGLNKRAGTQGLATTGSARWLTLFTLHLFLAFGGGVENRCCLDIKVGVVDKEGDKSKRKLVR